MVRHSSPQGKSITPEVATRLAPFRQPPLLEGEDEADYEQLRHRICAAVKPLDIFEEIFVADIINLEWEIWRWRRLKWSLIRARGLAALERFLPERLKRSKDRVRKAKILVRDYGRGEPAAVELIDDILVAAGTSWDALNAEAVSRGTR